MKYQLLNELSNFDTGSQAFIKFNYIFFALFVIILIYISIIDIKCLSIGFKEILIFFIFTVFYLSFKLIFSGNIILLDILKGAIFSILSFLIIILFTRNKGIGVGDMIFFTIAGINIGYINSIEALFIAFILGMVYSLILILLRRADFKTKIPFIPFLTAGILISFFVSFVN